MLEAEQMACSTSTCTLRGICDRPRSREPEFDSSPAEGETEQREGRTMTFSRSASEATSWGASSWSDRESSSMLAIVAS